MSGGSSFAAFWAGPQLSPFEYACLSSFRRHGYPVTLYSYDPIENLPEGVVREDAAAVAPRSDLDLFVYNGKPDLSHFSDHFRYLLFLRTDHIWIDTDILLLRPFDRALPATLLTKEHETSICGAVMRIDRRTHDVEALVRQTRALAGKPLRWGETGPMLLSTIFKRSDLFEAAFAPKLFYPVLYDVFWKVFLPEEREACAEACRDAYTLHLWNNIVVGLGVWKHMAPPQGSYLHACFQEAGVLDRFEGTYPADVMRRMVENWRLRHSGGDLNVGPLVRQLMPSAVRTARKRGWLRLAPHAG